MIRKGGWKIGEIYESQSDFLALVICLQSGLLLKNYGEESLTFQPEGECLLNMLKMVGPFELQLTVSFEPSLQRAVIPPFPFALT